MSDLVKRLRENALLDECEGATDYVVAMEREAADRIEELERELVRERNERREEGFKQVKELERELAAEKALAERLYDAVYDATWRDVSKGGAIEAYRKARGI